MPVKITRTEVGNAIIINPSVAKITADNQATSGNIALCLLLDSNSKPDVWCLVWEWGGDWMGFGDADRSNSEALSGWEPDAIREAIDNIGIRYGEECAEDMEWFAAWADDAEIAIGQKAGAEA